MDHKKQPSPASPKPAVVPLLKDPEIDHSEDKRSPEQREADELGTHEQFDEPG